MSKDKFRYRQSILNLLQDSSQPIPHREISHKILGHGPPSQGGKKKIVMQNSHKNLERELRDLVKDKIIDRLPGNFFRIRPAKPKKTVEAPVDERPRRNNRGNFRDNANREDRRGPRGRSGGSGGRKEFFRERAHEREHERGSERGLIGTVSKNSRGFAFVALKNPPEGLKEDIFLPPDQAEKLMTGDKVAIALDPPSRRSEKGPSGRLLKIMERGLLQAVGTYSPGDFMGPSVLVHNKDYEIRVFVDYEPAFRHVKEGSAVLVEITHHPKGREAARGKIVSVLADSLDATTDDIHIITKHKLRSFFPPEVVEESAAIPQTISAKDLEGRTDLRSLPFVTIDGADARDFDDAVCAEDLGGGKTRLWVAIADVAHYVKPGTALDKEAYERATSVYFPHRVLPMLPERLSNGICSLNPNEDRLAMVCEMDFDRDGNKTAHKVYEAVFQSQKRCVYEVLQEYFDDPKAHAKDYPEKVRASLNSLFKLYKVVQQKRFARGAIDLELPESKVVIGKKGEVLEIKRIERKDAHRLIEEFMIAANEAVSEIMEEHNLPFIFRVHETPEAEAFQRFMEVARSFGLLPPPVGKQVERSITPQIYQFMAEQIRDTAAARVLHFQLLRSMKQAFYSHENLRHFGLASEAYSHFTSPIRRYPDLIVHRLLKGFIRRDKKISQTAQGSVAEDLASAAQHCSERERAAADAEREMIRMKQVRYAEAHLGQEFDGFVGGMNQRGIYVELREVSLEGFIPLDRLSPDAEFNEKNMTVRLGKNKGLRLGDPIRVQIVKTNPHLLQIDLDPVLITKSEKTEKKRKSS